MAQCSNENSVVKSEHSYAISRVINSTNAIVDENMILNEMDIRKENVALIDIVAKKDFEILQWLACRRLLKNTYECPNCLILCTKHKRADSTDGFSWRCQRCDKRTSLRNGSMFARSRLSLPSLVTLIYCWSRNYQQQDIIHEAKIGKGSTHTIVDWCTWCRDVCEEDLISNPSIIGGLGDNMAFKVVEIDQTKLFFKKIYREVWPPDHWVLGGIERGTRRCFIVEVPDKTEETFAEIMQHYVLPGTIVVSDGRKPFDRLGEIAGGIYQHEITGPERLFIDPKEANMWVRARMKLKKRIGASDPLVSSYLHEFVWRNKFFNENIFANFIISISRQYQL